MVGAIQNFNNSVNFTGNKIRVVSDMYEALPNRAVKNVTSWDVAEGAYAPDAMSSAASSCVIGYIKNKTGFMFHSIPCDETNPFGKIKNTLEGAAQKLLKMNNEPLEGFLAGAHLNDSKSMEQAKEIIDIFKNIGVKFSAVVGRKQGYTNVFASAIDKEYMLAPSDFRGSSMRDLEKTYGVIIRNNNDKFVFK